VSPNISFAIKNEYVKKAIEQIQNGRRILKSFGFEFKPKYSYAVFTEKDKEWIKQNLGFSCGLPDEWFTDTASKVQDGGQCLSPSKGYIVFQIIGTKNSLAELDYYFGPVHEVFHSVQQILMDVDFGVLQSNYSCWFVESMPNLFNYLVLGSQGQDSLNRALDLRFSNFNRFVDGSSLLVKYGLPKSPRNWSTDDWVSLAMMKPAFGEKCRTVDNQYIGFGYWVGSIFTEKLILDFGMPKYLTFLSSLAGSSNFAQGFKDFTGVDEVSWLKSTAIPYLLSQSKFS